MKKQWKTIKPIIASSADHNKRYLTLLDEEGNILLANSRMQKELNLKNPRWEKNNFFDLLHPVHLEDFRNALRHSVISKNPYSTEFFLKNGRYHPMKWQVSYLTGSDHDLKTFICSGTMTSIDVPSTKQFSSRRNEAEIIHRAFLKNTPNLIWVLDEEGNLVFANHAFFEYFGLDETVLNKKISEFLPVAVVDALYKKYLEVLESGLPVESIENGITAEGASVIFRVNIFLIEGTAGRKLVGGIATNQSEKHHIEQKLGAANERLNHLHHLTSDAIWEWDMKTGKIYRNEKLIEMTGYLPEDFKGLSWWLNRVHPEDRDQLTHTLKNVTDKRLQSWESEYRFLCADGEYRYMVDHGFVLYENGIPVKMIGSLNDISNEKLMENLFAQEKLRQHKEISEAVIRMQEQERTHIGRELHDNVNQILGASKLFMDMVSPANEEEKDFKNKSLEYIVMAIEEIRKLSRELVAPELKEKCLVCSIMALIDDIHKTSNIKIKFIHDQESDLLSPGKKLALYRIVQEQLKNILKYSKATHVGIILQNNQDEVSLTIEDNGIGFSTDKTSSGVGLSNIKGRVKFYEGKTEINASPGKGCEIVVSLPLFD